MNFMGGKSGQHVRLTTVANGNRAKLNSKFRVGKVPQRIDVLNLTSLILEAVKR